MGLELVECVMTVEERLDARLDLDEIGHAFRPRTPGGKPDCTAGELLVDVCIPTTDGRLPVMPRYVEPESDQELVLEKLRLNLPLQPPPRIRGGEVVLPTPPTADSCSADL